MQILPSMPIVSCIETNPTNRTIQLAGVYVSLRKLERATSIDQGYLSRMLSGKRDPARMSIGVAMQIAGCLGFSVEDLIEAIYDRHQRLAKTVTKLQLWAEYLDAKERSARTRLANRGLPSPPSIPLI